jgi:hypothetical protein
MRRDPPVPCKFPLMEIRERLCMKLKMKDKDNCDFLPIKPQTVSFLQHLPQNPVKTGLASPAKLH